MIYRNRVLDSYTTIEKIYQWTADNFDQRTANIATLKLKIVNFKSKYLENCHQLETFHWGPFGVFQHPFCRKTSKI